MANNNYFHTKAVEADELGRIDEILCERINDRRTKWGIVRVIEDEQETNWKGELKWEDAECTIPTPKKEWGTVPKEAEDYTDDDYIVIDLLTRLRKSLQKMA